jgi:hypothetical protein
VTFASDQQPGKITYITERQKETREAHAKFAHGPFVEIGFGGPILYLSFTLFLL